MEIDRFVRYHRQRLDRRSAARARLKAELRARLPAVAAALTRLGARRVILFGSLASDRFEEDSDVDLAVEGLPTGSLIDAIAEASRVLHRPVDLIRIEAASPRLRARIQADGEVFGAG
jgi:predicted nucleotidyltransferase